MVDGSDLFNKGVMNQRFVAHWFGNVKRTDWRRNFAGSRSDGQPDDNS